MAINYVPSGKEKDIYCRTGFNCVVYITNLIISSVQIARRGELIIE